MLVFSASRIENNSFSAGRIENNIVFGNVSKQSEIYMKNCTLSYTQKPMTETETDWDKLKKRRAERGGRDSLRDREWMNEWTLFHKGIGLDSGSFYIQP